MDERPDADAVALSDQPGALVQRATRLALSRALVGGLLATVVAGGSALAAPGAPLRALLAGACLGSLPFVLPALLEAWLDTRGRSRPWIGWVGLYLVSLIGWALTFAQVLYLKSLSAGVPHAEAPTQIFQEVSAASGSEWVAQLMPPAALALASLISLGWIRLRRLMGWLLALMVGLVAALTWVGTQPDGPLASQVLALGLLALLGILGAALAVLIHALARPLSERLWPQSAPASPLAGEPPRPPLEPLSWGERLAIGGDPAQLAALLAWLGIGALLALVLQGWVPLLAAGCGWVIHVVVATNVPSFLLAFGRPERALVVARRFVAGRTRAGLPGDQRGVRLFREVEVRALLALGRLAEAETFRASLDLEEGTGYLACAARYRLAAAYFQAEAAQVVIDLVEPIPLEGALALPAHTLRAVALDMLDRSEEAHALSEALLDLAKRPADRGVTLNNLAHFELRRGGDLALALARSEEAYSSAPGPAVATTYGAALLAAGRATDALPLLEGARTFARSAPGAAWFHERLGACYLALGRGDEAHEALRAAAAAHPGSRVGQAASAALQELGEPPLAAPPDAAPDS